MEKRNGGALPSSPFFFSPSSHSSPSSLSPPSSLVLLGVGVAFLAGAAFLVGFSSSDEDSSSLLSSFLAAFLGSGAAFLGSGFFASFLPAPSLCPLSDVATAAPAANLAFLMTMVRSSCNKPDPQARA
jgi:hypothetical protein